MNDERDDTMIFMCECSLALVAALNDDDLETFSAAVLFTPHRAEIRAHSIIAELLEDRDRLAPSTARDAKRWAASGAKDIPAPPPAKKNRNRR